MLRRAAPSCTATPSGACWTAANLAVPEGALHRQASSSRASSRIARNDSRIISWRCRLK